MFNRTEPRERSKRSKLSCIEQFLGPKFITAHMILGVGCAFMGSPLAIRTRLRLPQALVDTSGGREVAEKDGLAIGGWFGQEHPGC